jgi:hypothetical protein
MKALTHSQARQLIEQAADGLLNPTQQSQLAAHLLGCAECRAFAAELAQLENAIGSTLKAHWRQPSLPKTGEQKLVKRLQGQFGKGSGKAASGLSPFIIIGGLIILLGIIFLLFANGGAPAAEPTATRTATHTATLQPSSTQPAAAVATDTPTPTALVLIAVPAQNANCREGNGSQFEVADTLLEGKKYSPIGRGTDNLWVLFLGPTNQTKCWAYIQNLDLFINDQAVAIADVPESLLPFVPYPATRTPTPTPTFTPEPFTPECRDGIDNDGDRRIDYPNDTSCSNANDNDETN